MSTDDQVSLVQSEDLDAVMALVDEEGWRGYSVADLAPHHANFPRELL